MIEKSSIRVFEEWKEIRDQLTGGKIRLNQEILLEIREEDESKNYRECLLEIKNFIDLELSIPVEKSLNEFPEILTIRLIKQKKEKK